jgi:hypothetical protein
MLKIKIYYKVIVLVYTMRTTIGLTRTVQTNNKWCIYELNSKFDKTYKIYLKVHNLILKKIDCLVVLLIIF